MIHQLDNFTWVAFIEHYKQNLQNTQSLQKYMVLFSKYTLMWA